MLEWIVLQFSRNKKKICICNIDAKVIDAKKCIYKIILYNRFGLYILIVETFQGLGFYM